MRLALLAVVLAACQRSGPVLTTPRTLLSDLRDGELAKYEDGATFVGTVKTVGEEEPGKPVVWMDVDGDNLMMMELAEPAPDLRAGDVVMVTCKLAGASGALMVVTDCVRGV